MKVAVYGTLRYGESANHLLRGCKRLGEDTVDATLYNLGWYPGVKLGTGDSVVVDVYEIPRDKICNVTKALDRYEGYHEDAPDQSLYTRKVATTKEGHEVSIYEYNHSIHEDKRIQNGDWKARA